MDVLAHLDAIPDAAVAERARKAIQLLRRICLLYPLDKIAFSFNGGKDSTVLLHLLRAAAAQTHEAETEFQGLGGIRSFYFRRSDDFQEVQEFVEHVDKQFSLGVEYLTEPDFKKGLCDYLERTGVMAIVLGTRRGDPNAGGQDIFCPSSDGWPAFMRVNPILDWTYHDVWQFLRGTHSCYCSLYDRGYTSLGGTANTLPNSALRRPDGSFEPAYHLADGRLERAGRAAPPKPGRGRGAGAAGADSLEPQLTRSAAIVVIGDELLSGKVEDVNARFLCRELRSLGWQVVRVVFVPDDVDEIACTVRAMAGAVELVLTSGGIGPTLDDLTMQGVARAVGQPLIRLPAMVQRLSTYFGGEAALSAAHLKMAEVPQNTELIDYNLPDSGEPSRFPVFKVDNIYVLPGVPHLLVQKWAAIKPLLQDDTVAPFHNATLRLALQDETKIAPALERVASNVGMEVSVGSYPVDRGIIITLDSKNSDKLEAAITEIQELLPAQSVLKVERDVATLDG